MKIRFTFQVLLSILFLSQAAFAEQDPDQDSKGNGIIAGRILDEDNLPLPGATVLIKSIHDGTVSDVDGFYRIVKLEAGEYELAVSYIGFKDETQKVQVEIGETSTVDIHLKAGIDLNEVIINGSLQGQSKALNQQKNNINIGNIISSDQVGRFPDANIGDAIKRIPGINVQYDQGEARFGQIRGTSPELNSITINGDRIPSAEAESRSIQLDLVPADMIQTIEVNKVVTPDMDADAIGGSVNLVTKSSPYKRRISGTLGTNYNFFLDKPTIIGGLMYGDRYLNSKLGMILSASYQNNQLGSDNIEAEWEKDDANKIYTADFQIRTYQVQRERQSYSASFDYAINENHKLELKGLYNHRKDWENRFRLRYKDIEQEDDGSWIAEVRRQTKGGSHDEKEARLEDQKAMDFSLGGKHFFGAIQLDWKASYAKANEDRPHERYISYRAKKTPLSVDLSNTKKPQFWVTDADKEMLNSNYGLKELNEQFQYTEDVDKNFKMNVEIPISRGKFESTIKTGFAYKSKKKNRDNKFKEYEPTDENAFDSNSLNNLVIKTKSDFLAGDYVAGNFVSNDYLAGLDLENSGKFNGETVLEELAGNFDAKENVIANYVRFDQQLGRDLKLVAGLRMENTQLEYSGYEFLVDANGDASLNKTDVDKDYYTNFLPSLIAKYSFSKNSKLKAAWTNTISRPKYYDLVPHVEINLEDMEANIGNPALEATESMNLDIMFEHYFNTVGVISGGVFYKDLKNATVDQELRDYNFKGTIYEKFKQPVNAGDADLYGFEFAFQRQFDFLPGFWKQFGLYTNYTYTHSKMKNITLKGRENDELQLAGTPENIVNASLYYEGKKITVRASLNYADAFIDEPGETAFYDRYYDKVTYLDMNASYAINKQFQFFAELNNLLNTPLRYYQGEEQYTMQSEYYDTKVNLGLKFNF
jgi:TonB-dependent receptor